MKQSLKEDLIRFMAKHPQAWFTKAELTKRNWWYPDGVRTYLPDTVGRALRQAESESRIAVKDDPGSVSIIYRFLPVDKRSNYIPWSFRTIKTNLFKE